MLEMAVKAQLPLIAVTTRDNINVFDVLKHITKKEPQLWLPNTILKSGVLYVYLARAAAPWVDVYTKMAKQECSLIIVNVEKITDEMFFAGELPTPREMLTNFMTIIVDDKKVAQNLALGLGGCTLKEAIEMARYTMARDLSLTPKGLMTTRKEAFQSSKGLTQVDVDQAYYSPPEDIVEWSLLEKPFFFADTDPRLVPRGILADGPPGCVAEGTLIRVKRGKRNTGRFMPIEKLYEKFNGIGKPVSPWRKELPSFTQSWLAESGKVVYNLIEGVYDKGMKPCFRIVTSDAGDVILTGDHPVLNAEGVFVPTESLKHSDRILARASMLPQGEGKQVSKPRVVVEGLKFYASGWFKDVWDKEVDKVYTYKGQHRARLVVEAGMNNLSYEAYVHALKTDQNSLGFQVLPDTVDVHHIDENPQNDAPENLQVLLREQHFLLHDPQPEWRFKTEYTRETEVLSVDYVGMRRTFDLSMGEPAANFVVNQGLIVHNTGKTAAAKWLAAQWGIPLFRMDIGGTKNKFVGESENNLLTNLSRLDQEEPCIVLFDEVEKVFGGCGEVDGGTTTTMLSQVLWWLAEHKSRVFTFMTTNAVQKLPKELYREGRIDRTMYFGGLSNSDAEQFVHALLTTFPHQKWHEDHANVMKIVKSAYGAATIPNSKPARVSQAALTTETYEQVKRMKK